MTRHGRLILVVGPSGAGKDTLIGAAKDRLADDDRFFFVRRIITRPAGAHEDNDYASIEQFEEMRTGGAFLLEWNAHGQSYGIPASVSGLLDSSINVVANVSRTVLNRVRAVAENVQVIQVTAQPNILRERLMQRGREDAARVEERIHRSTSVSMPTGLSADTIDNSGTLEQGIDAFVQLLLCYAEPSGQRENTLKRALGAG